MFFLILALVLFLLGLAGSLIQGAGEVWLWFVSLGLVLDLTILLLTLTDWQWLRPLRKLDVAGRIAHILIFVAAGIGFWFRLRAENGIFNGLMVVAALLWAFSLFRLNQSLLGRN